MSGSEDAKSLYVLCRIYFGCKQQGEEIRDALAKEGLLTVFGTLVNKGLAEEVTQGIFYPTRSGERLIQKISKGYSALLENPQGKLTVR